MEIIYKKEKIPELRLDFPSGTDELIANALIESNMFHGRWYFSVGLQTYFQNKVIRHSNYQYLDSSAYHPKKNCIIVPAHLILSFDGYPIRNDSSDFLDRIRPILKKLGLYNPLT